MEKMISVQSIRSKHLLRRLFNSFSMEKPYHSSVFDNISDERKQALLDAASAEFAAAGYTGADINAIAKKAGISIRSLYTYFAAKEDLFLTVTANNAALLAETLEKILKTEGDFFEKVEIILRTIQNHTHEQSGMIKLYNRITTENSEKLIKKLAQQMETAAAACYTALIEEAWHSGLIAADFDPRTAAFHLDTILRMVQFSYGSPYHRERMKVFLAPVPDPDTFDDEKFITETMKFIRRAFS